MARSYISLDDLARFRWLRRCHRDVCAVVDENPTLAADLQGITLVLAALALQYVRGRPVPA